MCGVCMNRINVSTFYTLRLQNSKQYFLQNLELQWWDYICSGQIYEQGTFAISWSNLVFCLWLRLKENEAIHKVPSQFLNAQYTRTYFPDPCSSQLVPLSLTLDYSHLFMNNKQQMVFLLIKLSSHKKKIAMQLDVTNPCEGIPSTESRGKRINWTGLWMRYS